MIGWWRRARMTEARTAELIDALVQREAEVNLLAEVLARIGVRPVGCEPEAWSIREWARERVERSLAEDPTGASLLELSDWTA